MAHYQSIALFVVAFAVVALAARQVGDIFAHFKLPKITGYLFTGLLTGPFILNIISEEAVESLRFVDEVSLAFIAFAAGSELYLPDLQGRLKSIGWVTAGLVFFTLIMATSAVFFMADFIPIMQGMLGTEQLAVAILAGSILVARSPASAIAIINELRAKGPFTQTALGVTVIMDVFVIVIFAISSSVADALLTDVTFDFSFVLLLIVNLSMAVILGGILAKVLSITLAAKLERVPKTTIILLFGFGVFVLSTFIREYSHEHFPFEILIEPLLVCLIASFMVNNYSKSRGEFREIIEKTGPIIYIAFFTLTGDSLELDILIATWPIALVLFGTRLAAIMLGSFTGGVIAGDPMKHNRLKWMAFVTQAGVALGLAKEVAVEFPELGTAFATMIISVVVLNEIVGPLFFKYAINQVGEAHIRKTQVFDGVRDAILFGHDGPTLALAQQLCAHNWVVKVASTNPNFNSAGIDQCDFTIHHISDLSLETLHRLDAHKAEVIVAMLPDEDSYQVCELAYENFGTETLVVRLNDPQNYKRFRELGALIVDPRTAIVGLLVHFVRSPAVAPMLLGAAENQDIIDIEVRDPSLHGVRVRDLRLPLDTLILSILREGHTLITHGHTRLQLGDRVTVVGSIKSLDEVLLRFDA
ncbi:MAG TPA: cation:proton antiporter [Anaerolineae bacterium]|nr:cation:proton antiporter [Anaerolineae bacterium]HRV93117.1 cation:proton antiporter [Anaerolineae bacterium]